MNRISDINKYYEATRNRDTREDLIFAVGQVNEPKIALDCGCGSGADINYLVQNGFTVHGFDVEELAIAQCKKRFDGLENVFLSRSTFNDFDYPKVSLVVADASLFFCPAKDFNRVWQKITDCLVSNGVFCGSFLGLEDSMVTAASGSNTLWPGVNGFKKEKIKTLFQPYKLLRLKEHFSSGIDQLGKHHNWHVFQVVALKK